MTSLVKNTYKEKIGKFTFDIRLEPSLLNGNLNNYVRSYLMNCEKHVKNNFFVTKVNYDNIENELWPLISIQDPILKIVTEVKYLIINIGDVYDMKLEMAPELCGITSDQYIKCKIIQDVQISDKGEKKMIIGKNKNTIFIGQVTKIRITKCVTCEGFDSFLCYGVIEHLEK